MFDNDEILTIEKIRLSNDGKGMVAETNGIHKPGGLTFAIEKHEPDSLLVNGDRITVSYSEPTSGQIVKVERFSYKKWEQIWPK